LSSPSAPTADERILADVQNILEIRAFRIMALAFVEISVEVECLMLYWAHYNEVLNCCFHSSKQSGPTVADMIMVLSLHFVKLLRLHILQATKGLNSTRHVNDAVPAAVPTGRDSAYFRTQERSISDPRATEIPRCDTAAA